MITELKQVHTRLRLEEGPSLYSSGPVNTPEDAARLLAEHMKDMDREYCVVVNLDSALQPLNFHILTMGGISQCMIPKEKLFQSAILSNASSILLLHNHPSGNNFPSRSDMEVTESIIKAGSIVNIPLVDHVIISGGSGDIYSMRQEHPEIFSPQPETLTPSELEDTGREKIDRLMEQLKEGVKNIFDSDNYKEYLKTLSKFHNYSINNNLLIAMQRPDASRVASISAWNRMGRQVKKGSHGIAILCPVPVKEKRAVRETDENGDAIEHEQEYTELRFKTGYVFDISDTQGPPLPSIEIKELSGSVAMYDDFIRIISEDISPVPVRYNDISSGAKGYYSNADKEIVIKKDMSDFMTLKVLIHEVCHALLHDRDTMRQKGEEKDRQTMEVEAESTAYTVCSAIDPALDTGDYSFGYIAGWSYGRDIKVLQDSLNTIKAVSHEIIGKIEEGLLKIDRLEIYQTDPEGKDASNMFRGYDERNGVPVSSEDYRRVFLGRYHGESPDEIFTRFNIDKPEGFTGHSLSISDVIVIHKDGTDTAYFTDNFGFREIRDFKNSPINHTKEEIRRNGEEKNRGRSR